MTTTSRADLEREIALEQAHVDRVYANLTTATASAKNLAQQGREIFISDRTDFLREEDGTALFERDAFAYQAAKRLAILDAEHEGLVFGRIDLTTDEVRYIGRIGVRDEDYEPLVIDWRAPAAEPFYRATPAEPMKVIRRRVLRCRDDKVVGLEDDLLDSSAATDLPILGEGALMAALSRARGRTMRDIVATIQAEQDEAIRAPYQGVTIIAGGPGTGKTVVALHRAAYLLYTNRARLEKGGVLVVGPSSVFMNYIERVLPSLGEDSVTLKAIGSVASDVLGFSTERVDQAAAATIKGSLAMQKVLKHLVRAPLPEHDVDSVRVTVKGEVLGLGARELHRIREQVLSSVKLNKGRRMATDLVAAALIRKFPGDVEIEPQELEAQVREHPSLHAFMPRWWPLLSATRVLARLADPAVVAEVAAGELDEDQRACLVSSYRWLEAADEGDEIVRGWSVADIALLDELIHILGVPPEDVDKEPDVFLEGGAVAEVLTTADLLRHERHVDPDEDPHNTYAHILVDEGQDVTPMQWRMLRRRGPQSSWTIVGDPAQSSYPNQEETSRALNEVVGRAASRTFTLSTNYRSPSEVFEFAAKVITKVFPDADLPKAVRSTGVEPSVEATTTEALPRALREHLLSVAAKVNGTIGVIVPPSRLRAVQLGVFQDPRLAAFEDRLIVVTALQAKGLEYDGVLVVSPDEIIAESPGGARVLYVALTRATQKMITLDVDTSQWRALLD
ncbi:AAA family ATPase [Tessaracoccus sp. MC1865]|uniref:HelD family protein n=1 Tax=Tessaracoccus sp. MC1865 TaxID=2760310 RepID=UPI0015FF0262|nr:UvrD-helicase domain-containing protein [Tessaracoccus sp. MC1865]MBB1483616.1 AAA family ATPase [Tessaracoccus sp. MC1865]QTO36695.1 AAA family ATPase [Tessaracoccus sp. MC1865]